MKFEDSLQRLLLFFQKHGGYRFGHLPLLNEFIPWLEDIINNKGRPVSRPRRLLAKSLHWLFGHSIFYLDYENGNDSNDGSSWSSAWRTITNGPTSSNVSAGDVIRIAKSPDPTSLGVNATWTNLSPTVSLASALTANIDMCENAWTSDSSDVTTSTDSYYRKEGSYSAKFSFDSPGKGKLAHHSLGSTVDLSAYRQVSFWIYTTGAINDGVLSLRLCSDDSGDTTVNTINIPAIPATYKWQVVTVDTGGALGDSIQSITLYADDYPPSYITVYLDDIIACKDPAADDSLTLSSLISKNSSAQGGSEVWWGIRSINDKTIVLEGRGYWGTTETVSTYKRETIKTDLASSGNIQEVVVSGESGNNIEFQGGYDTSNSEQNGETYFDGQNFACYGLYLNSKSYVTLNYLNFYRYQYDVYLYYSSYISIPNIVVGCTGEYYQGFQLNGSNHNSINNITANASGYGVYLQDSYDNSISNVAANGNQSEGIYLFNSSNNRIGTVSANNNEYYGLELDGASNRVSEVTSVNNNGTAGILFDMPSNIIENVSSANNNGQYGVIFYHDNNYIYYLSTGGNGLGGIKVSYFRNYIFNAAISESTEVDGYKDFADSRLFSHNHDQTADNHKIFTDGGLISSETSVRHTDSGIAWQLSPTSTNRNENYPLSLVIARVACSANNEVSVKVWMRKDDATGITGKLVCRGNQIAGVPNDVVAVKSDEADTWEELEIKFTPTEAGVVEIEAWAYGGTSYNVYVDDMTITQS